MTSKYEKQKTWKDAVELLTESYDRFTALIQKQIKLLKPTEADKKRFRALIGSAPIDGQLRRSDLKAGCKFAEYVAKEVRDLRRVSKDLDFYHLTLLADEGNMPDREPLFCLRGLKRKADKAMRKAGLDGIFVIEVQALMNWPQQGEGRTLLAHVHALGWKRQNSPNNSAEDLRRTLGYDRRRRSLAWSCQFGAKPIVIRHLTIEKGCPSFWAAYLMKAPHDAKSLRPNKNYNGSFGQSEFKLWKTTSGYPPELAMRVLELYAQLPLFAMIGGVGSGAAMLRRCKCRIQLWDAKRRAKWKKKGLEAVPTFDEPKFWKRTHKNRRVPYLAFFVDGPTITPLLRWTRRRRRRRRRS